MKFRYFRRDNGISCVIRVFYQETALRVLSGIQPSGRLHIGNYFGAMRQHLQLQKEHEGFYFIADYHALTSNPEPKDAGTIYAGCGDGLSCAGA